MNLEILILKKVGRESEGGDGQSEMGSMRLVKKMERENKRRRSEKAQRPTE